MADLRFWKKWILPNEFYFFALDRGIFIYAISISIFYLLAMIDLIVLEDSYHSINGAVSLIFLGPIFFNWYETLSLIINILEILTHALLAYGVFKKFWKMLIPWLVFNGIYIAVLPIFAIIFVLEIPLDALKEFVFGFTPMLLSILLGLFYPYLCVWSLCHKFRRDLRLNIGPSNLQGEIMTNIESDDENQDAES